MTQEEQLQLQKLQIRITALRQEEPFSVLDLKDLLPSFVFNPAMLLPSHVWREVLDDMIAKNHIEVVSPGRWGRKGKPRILRVVNQLEKK